MKKIVGIVRRIMAVAIFIGFSAVVCCGVSKNPSIAKGCPYHQKEEAGAQQYLENLQPNQLVSIRIMELI